MSVLSKLMDARLQLQSMKLTKTGHNKFAGYNYFELGDFLPAVQQIFHGLKLAGVVSYGHDLATLTITDIEDSQSVQLTSPMSTAALKGCHEVQNLGAVETYIRRYLWVTALEIVEHDALDATTGQTKPGERKENGTIEGKGTHSATTGAWEALDDEEREFLTEEAVKVGTRIQFDPIDAAQYLMSLKLDPEEMVAIWTRFNSKERASLKAAKTKIESGENHV